MARPRAARWYVPADEADPAVWLAHAEHLEETASRQESDPHGRGVDHAFVASLRGRARFALRKAEELLGGSGPTRSA